MMKIVVLAIVSGVLVSAAPCSVQDMDVLTSMDSNTKFVVAAKNCMYGRCDRIAVGDCSKSILSRSTLTQGCLDHFAFDHFACDIRCRGGPDADSNKYCQDLCYANFEDLRTEHCTAKDIRDHPAALEKAMSVCPNICGASQLCFTEAWKYAPPVSDTCKVCAGGVYKCKTEIRRRFHRVDGDDDVCSAMAAKCLGVDM